MNRKINTKDDNTERPPYTMVKLVGQALIYHPILDSEEVVDWITNTYSFYRNERKHVKIGVQKSLREFKYFTRVGNSKKTWSLAPEFRDLVKKTVFIPRKINANGKLCRITLEKEAKQLEEANMVPSEELPTLEINVKPELEPLNKLSTAYKTKEERDEIKVEEPPSIYLSPSSEAFKTPHEIKLRPPRIIDLTGESRIDPIDLTGEYTRRIDPRVIDLTEDTDGDVVCPICNQQFIDNEKLGEHVRSHQSLASSSNVMRMKETFENLASTVFGSDKNVPICVFTGNVYLSRESS